MAKMTDGYIYLILDREHHAGKIGYSNQPLHRLAQMETGNLAFLELYATARAEWPAERDLHDLLKNYRIRKEWYRNLSMLRSIFCILEEEAFERQIFFSHHERDYLTRDEVRDIAREAKSDWLHRRISDNTPWSSARAFTYSDEIDAGVFIGTGNAGRPRNYTGHAGYN